jgi:hypothetical protein
MSHCCAVDPAIGLKSGAVNGWTFASIEHPPMDAGAVRGARHQAVEHIQLADQVPFADSSNRWIAGHLTNVLAAERDKSDSRAAASRGCRRFAAGMTGTDDQDVEHPSGA